VLQDASNAPFGRRHCDVTETSRQHGEATRARNATVTADL